ncbi:MAG TPA: NAD(P)/FAD-dependent oxidoreductase [Steroidobacteraceae bacterium]|nr:NAD(P)/FAD-dependent oxidoreductase [Steroidobacteraceae bacterium]
MQQSERRPIVVGAGPAGLAVAASLARHGISCTMLEQGTAVGTTWRGHYDRLHLHTDKAHSSLPFLPFPRSCPRYPSRQQVIDYLEDYARGFGLQPRFGQKVREARRTDGRWHVHTEDESYSGPELVIATGHNRERYLPDLPGMADFRGTLLHSADYRNGAPYRKQKVLVVGLGNSGGEIAIDLCEHGAHVSVAVRGPVNVVPRDLLGIPIVAVAAAERMLPPRLADALNAPILRAALGDLASCGLRRPAYGAMTQFRREARPPLIDVGTIGLIRRGAIGVRPAVVGFAAENVVFSDGTRAGFDAVVLATGYRARVHAFLQDAAPAHRADGTPLSSGRESELPGLYFCGYRVAPTGMLHEIAREALRIARAIAERH